MGINNGTVGGPLREKKAWVMIGKKDHINNQKGGRNTRSGSIVKGGGGGGVGKRRKKKGGWGGKKDQLEGCGRGRMQLKSKNGIKRPIGGDYSYNGRGGEGGGSQNGKKEGQRCIGQP